MFYKPEEPFLLVSKDETGDIDISWHKNEIDLVIAAQDVISFGGEIIYSMEIGLLRNIDLIIE